jgi:hypothetical protein
MRRASVFIYDRFSANLGVALELLGTGLCSQEMKERFKELISARAERLTLRQP